MEKYFKSQNSLWSQLPLKGKSDTVGRFLEKINSFINKYLWSFPPTHVDFEEILSCFLQFANTLNGSVNQDTLAIWCSLVW